WRGPAGVVPSLPPLGRRGAVAVALTAGVSDGTRGAACLLHADRRQGYRCEDGGRWEESDGEGERVCRSTELRQVPRRPLGSGMVAESRPRFVGHWGYLH